MRYLGAIIVFVVSITIFNHVRIANKHTTAILSILSSQQKITFEVSERAKVKLRTIFDLPSSERAISDSINLLAIRFFNCISSNYPSQPVSYTSNEMKVNVMTNDNKEILSTIVFRFNDNHTKYVLDSMWTSANFNSTFYCP
jgi:hypothetical protein